MSYTPPGQELMTFVIDLNEKVPYQSVLRWTQLVNSAPYPAKHFANSPAFQRTLVKLRQYKTTPSFEWFVLKKLSKVVSKRRGKPPQAMTQHDARSQTTQCLPVKYRFTLGKKAQSWGINMKPERM